MFHRNKYDYDLIVIGGGSGGLSIASGAGQLGVKTLLVNKENLGGDCLHYGCVPSKALIKSGKIAHYIRDQKKFGLGDLSKTQIEGGKIWETIIQRISNIQAGIQLHDSRERFENLGCEVIFGKAQFINSHEIKISPNLDLEQKQTNSEKKIKFSAKKIVIATGSKPRIPEVEGLSETGFLTNETIFSTKKFPQKLAIIGGGVIASEISQAMKRLGSEVTIIEKHKKFFGHFDTDISELMTKKFQSEGIEVLLNATPKKVSIQKEGLKEILIEIKKAGGKEEEKYVFDEIFVTAGRIPNTDLDLEKANVHYNERGIRVDKKCRTSQPHILAIGDVNGKMPFTHAANYEAGIVLSNEILHIPSKAHYDSIGWTIYTDPEIASIGMNEEEARKKDLNFQVVKFQFDKNDRALTESETDGFVKVILGKREKILGVQIVGSRSGEMIREWQLAMSQNIKFSRIARSTYIYPTFGEASKWVAGSYYGQKLFTPKIKQILKVLFGYRGR